MSRTIHPFPARMASDIALAQLATVQGRATVLDPMAGSGTVVRQAATLGHHAIAFDLDPLAVLMTRVATTPTDDGQIEQVCAQVVKRAREVNLGDVRLPWIDDDAKTSKFIEYWFGEEQRGDLRRLAYTLHELLDGGSTAISDVLRLALSRIIVTKDRGASLARDVSHSRPHKVMERSDFDVFRGFDLSVRQLRRMLTADPPRGGVDVQLGDARSMRTVSNRAIDVVLTSPPYLNAIDYMRGHRLSLVWLGYSLPQLREVRTHSIGAERAPDVRDTAHLFSDIQDAMCAMHTLSSRDQGMIARYSEDVYRLMSEVARVLKTTGRAILVVGNSCLKGTSVQSSEGIVRAAYMVGLRLDKRADRPLETRSRYLPTPANGEGSLGKRMRTEVVLTFVPA